MPGMGRPTIAAGAKISFRKAFARERLVSYRASKPRLFWHSVMDAPASACGALLPISPTSFRRAELLPCPGHTQSFLLAGFLATRFRGVFFGSGFRPSPIFFASVDRVSA